MRKTHMPNVKTPEVGAVDVYAALRRIGAKSISIREQRGQVTVNYDQGGRHIHFSLPIAALSFETWADDPLLKLFTDGGQSLYEQKTEDKFWAAVLMIVQINASSLQQLEAMP